MALVGIDSRVPLAQADPRRVDAAALERDLRTLTTAAVRFDAASRALYSTDASVYEIPPLGVVIAKTRDDLVEIVRLCAKHRCPLTLRGGGTSQAGQAIGSGLIADTSRHLNRVLEVNPAERWARVEPGIVLDELNRQLKEHGLRFAPDISTASRATVGGMMANNSSGARSVLYGKTIDHVLEQTVVLADGTVVEFRDLSDAEADEKTKGDSLEAACYRVVRQLARQHAGEIEKRYPKVLRRVGGYNLDEFTGTRPVNLSRMMVGSEGTLGVVLEAKLKLVPLPKAKGVLTIQFHELLDALGATPRILTHQPSAIEVMDGFILNHTQQAPALHRMRQRFIEGDPGALLCVEFYDATDAAVAARVHALEADLRAAGVGYHYHAALTASGQADIWKLRESALGLSMAMKADAKSLSFVEDTAVAPERLRDFIDRFQQLLRAHGTHAGIYAHASVGCLHVRPVVNMKTADGVAQFRAIAEAVSDLVLEFGGALSGEHGDGLVRSPFMEKMFGPVLYEAFRTVKKTFDPHGIFNPGKIVDAPRMEENLRFGAGYRTPNPPTFFDYSEYGGWGGAVEMCSGLGACRKELDGTMCPSYMATRNEEDSTRGRANVLRMTLNGRAANLDDHQVHAVLDLCLECRACKTECPVGVDMARHKSEFLAGYWKRHGLPLSARVLGNARATAKWGARLAPLSNWLADSPPGRWAASALLGIDARRSLPRFARRTLAQLESHREPSPGAVLFVDTFTEFYEPEVGVAAMKLLRAAGRRPALAPNGCCGRPLISKGLLSEARVAAEANAERLSALAEAQVPIVFCEPSCLSAVREDAPALLRGESRRKAEAVARASRLLEEHLADLPLPFEEASTPRPVVLHGHCHQRSMGLLDPAKRLMGKVPGVRISDPEASCCGMAGSFGYTRDHYEVSVRMAERRLLPAVRNREAGAAVLASGFSCRHQISGLSGVEAMHPAVYLASLLKAGESGE